MKDRLIFLAWIVGTFAWVAGEFYFISFLPKDTSLFGAIFLFIGIGTAPFALGRVIFGDHGDT